MKQQQQQQQQPLGLKHRTDDKINRGKGKTRGRFCDVSIADKTIKHRNTLYMVFPLISNYVSVHN